MLKLSLAIFVKTPGMTPAKTRLGKVIGQPNAEEFYSRAIECIREQADQMVKKHKNLHVFWSVAEADPNALNLWQDYSSFSQVTGGLGTRLWGTDEELSKRSDVAMFMGSDTPHVNFDLIEAFVDRVKKLYMESKDPWCLMAPTEDGGFWMMARNQPINRDVWESVEYSAATTCDELCRALENSGYKIEKFNPPQFDVDTVEELKRLSQLSTDKLMPQQKSLVEWSAHMSL